MAEPEVEAAWRAEVKWCGATQSRDALNSDGGFTDELKRQAAFWWLGGEAEARRFQQEQSYTYVRWILGCRRCCVGRPPLTGELQRRH